MLKVRVVTSLIITPLTVALVLLLDNFGFAVLTGVLVLCAIWEWLRLIGYGTAKPQTALILANAFVMLLLWIYRDSLFSWGVIVAGVSWWLLATLWLRHFSFAAAPTRENKRLKLLAGSLIVLPAWIALVQVHSTADNGHAWALFALVLVWSADSAAYFAGSRWGTTKLAPRISPGKTRMGVYGALGACTVVALLGGWWLGVRDLALCAVIGLALVSVVFSIVGDLFESLIKRHSNAKDSGTLIPGHGGVFDRLDSVFAAVPVFAAGKALLGI